MIFRRGKCPKCHTELTYWMRINNGPMTRICKNPKCTYKEVKEND